MGKNYGMVIGINSYDNLQNLKCAEQDASSIRNYFVEDAGFEEVYHFAKDAASISSSSGPPIPSVPSFANLRRFLDIRFRKSFLTSGDTFWFFFAGHGLRHANRDYLMPYDGYPDGVEATGLSLNYVTERLRRCGADNVVLLVDACRSQGRRDGLGVGQSIQKGVITIFSCSPSESSYEINELGHGSFTHVLLDALRIRGEGNCATVERLDRHLRQYVPALNRRYDKPSQTPYVMLEPASKHHLILLSKQATAQDIATLREDAGEAELEGERELAEQLWTRVLALSPADPRALRALKRIWSSTSTSSSSSPSPQSASSSQREGDRSRLEARSDELDIASPPLFQPSPSAPSLSSLMLPIVSVRVDRQGKVIERHESEVPYRVEDLGNGVRLELVWIPGGSFVMGSPSDELERSENEGPQRKVTVQPFWMGRYPVTQAQWKAIASFRKVKHDLKLDPSEFKGATHPVECVNWNDAVECCARLSRHTNVEYRLPSEAEWEYACRAGSSTPFHFGETITPDLANYRSKYAVA